MSQQQPLKPSVAPVINISKEDPEKLYQLVEVIGTGSYGEVFKVFFTRTTKRFLLYIYWQLVGSE
jgi:serine/threonine protein kinase